MDQTETILLRVNLDVNQVSANMTNLKGQINDLNAKLAQTKQAIKETGDSDKSLAEQQAQLEASLKRVNEQYRQQVAQLNNATKITESAAGSIDQLRAIVSAGTAQWNALSAAERENVEVGGLIQSTVKNASDQLKVLEGSIGDMRRNVGNYTESLQPLNKSISESRQEHRDLTNTVRGATAALAIMNLTSGDGSKQSDLYKDSMAALVVVENTSAIKLGFLSAARTVDTIQTGLQTSGTAALTTVQKTWNVVVGESTGLLYAFRIALALTGIGALVFLLYEAITNWQNFGSAIDSSTTSLKTLGLTQQEFDKYQKQVNENLATEMSKLNEYLAIAKDENASRMVRLDAIKDLKKEFPDYLSNLDLENVNSQAIADTITNKLIPALQAQAKFMAAQEELKDLYKQLYDAQNQNADATVTWTQKTGVLLGTLSTFFTDAHFFKDFGDTYNSMIGAIGEANSQDQINKLNDQIQNITKNALVPAAEKLKTLDDKVQKFAGQQGSISFLNKALEDAKKRLDDLTVGTAAWSEQLEKVESLTTQLDIAKEIQSILSSIGGAPLIDEGQSAKDRQNIQKLGDDIDQANQLAQKGLADISKSQADGVKSNVAATEKGNNAKLKSDIGYIQQAGRLFDEFFRGINQNENAQLQNLQLRRREGVISEQQYAKDVSAIKRKQAIADKEDAVFHIIIDEAQAIVRDLGAPGKIILDAAIGAAELALVVGQKIPSFARGGAPQLGVFGGNPHAAGGTHGYFDDGTHIEVERGEMFAVVNKRSTGMLRNLSGLNVAGGGVPFMAEGGLVGTFNDGGYAARYATNQVTSQLNIEALADTLRKNPPVVNVVDINVAQNQLSVTRNRANI